MLEYAIFPVLACAHLNVQSGERSCPHKRLLRHHPTLPVPVDGVTSSHASTRSNRTLQSEALSYASARHTSSTSTSPSTVRRPRTCEAPREAARAAAPNSTSLPSRAPVRAPKMAAAARRAATCIAAAPSYSPGPGVAPARPSACEASKRPAARPKSATAAAGLTSVNEGLSGLGCVRAAGWMSGRSGACGAEGADGAPRRVGGRRGGQHKVAAQHRVHRARAQAERACAYGLARPRHARLQLHEALDALLRQRVANLRARAHRGLAKRTQHKSQQATAADAFERIMARIGLFGRHAGRCLQSEHKCHRKCRVAMAAIF
eukprot:6179099-Pleurochrysis_carterae.AAC.2